MTVHTTSSAATTSLGKKNTSLCGSGGAPVKVCLRLRPMNKLEYARRSKNFVEVHYDTENPNKFQKKNNNNKKQRSQKETVDQDKQNQATEIINYKNDIQVLKQMISELNMNLKVSTYRENESSIFLRQFRRFYRRLLRNKAAQGTGDTASLISKVPGVPDLEDLIDIDSLLYESGLIEESEMYNDGSVEDYQPSTINNMSKINITILCNYINVIKIYIKT